MLHIQYLPYNHPLVLELGQASHSNITVIHLSTCTLTCAITFSIPLHLLPSNKLKRIVLASRVILKPTKLFKKQKNDNKGESLS